VSRVSISVRYRIGKIIFTLAAFSFILLGTRHGVAAQSSLRRRPMSASPHPGSFWNDTHLLIVDDEPDLREIFAAWFRNLGCNVTEASDGVEALEALAKGSFDAIISDVGMPKLDGIQLMKRIQTSGPHTPVLVLISGFNDMTRADAYDLGVEVVLSKPCERKHLIAALRTCLLRRQYHFSPPVLEVASPAFQIICDFPDSAEAVGVAIGWGGISLPWNSDAAADAVVSFDLSFPSGAVRRLAGTGIVRWCEDHSCAARLGIEFIKIQNGSIEEFNRYIDPRRPCSFIPKGSPSAAVSA
jgi:CheY-like chemotaxis protein